MIHDVIENSECRFGISPKVYPVLIVGKDGEREGALFTQHELRRAIKRMKRYPELLEEFTRQIDKKRSEHTKDSSLDWVVVS